MATIAAEGCTLLVIDLQARLMPAIEGGEEVVENTRRLIAAAALLGVPVEATEQYPQGLGHSLPGLLPEGLVPLEKTTFDALRTPAVAAALAGDGPVVVTGCEAHVCVMQTVAGLLDAGRRVHVAADATGSRREASRQAALARMARLGADIATTEMVIFEWLGDAAHPRFREALALVK